MDYSECRYGFEENLKSEKKIRAIPFISPYGNHLKTPPALKL